jgi:MFS family permease
MNNPDIPVFGRSPVFNILVAIYILLIGNGMLTIFLSVDLATKHVPTGIIGLVMSGYYFGFIAGTRVAHRIVNSFGHIRAFVIFAAIAACSSLLHGVTSALPAWLLLRFMFGFCFVGLYMVAESWLNHHATANRGHLLAVYTIVGNLGVASGQLFLGFTSPQSLELILFTGFFITAGLLPIAMTRAENPVIDTADTLSVGELFKVAPMGILFAIGSGVILGSYYTLAPAWGIRIGLDAKMVSYLMGSTLLGSVVFQVPIGKISDKYDRRQITIYICGIITLLALTIAILDPRGWLLLPLVFLFGGFYYSLYPLAVCITADEFSRERLVAASATILQIWGISAAFGPIVSAWLMSAFGPDVLFYFFAVTGLLLTLTGYKWRRLGHVPEEQSEFIAVPRTTPIIAQLDPRTEEL